MKKSADCHVGSVRSFQAERKRSLIILVIVANIPKPMRIAITTFPKSGRCSIATRGRGEMEKKRSVMP